ncbi:hypothetical protein GCM10018793_07140 [Streptomyces sulfonofaciens]|uniref:Uncharacterized protein n=1 Tax=Streptomyces sulfonofaciens TaxID=68272 RepID=A0A919KSN5_9ACTN|nr:hypothetical protein GCM10018793_07140 [Streptomyces sulfonofaciens]
MSTIHWTTGRTHRSARWHSESAAPLPQRTVVADDRMKADDAYRRACEGTALLWQGDFHNGRQLLHAMGRRIDRVSPRPSTSLSEAFHLHRRSTSHRAHVLGKLLVPLDDDHRPALRRAPDTRQACLEAYGPRRDPWQSRSGNCWE